MARTAQITTFESAYIAPGRPLAARLRVLKANRPRALLIDDDVHLLETFRGVLRSEFEVDVATGGRTGLDALASDAAYDVIVCDVQMPDVDGMQVYRELRRRDPDQARRLLFFTGGIPHGEIGRIVAAGEPIVVHKPCTRAHLLGAMQRVMTAAAAAAVSSPDRGR
ncbi:MAG: response regulator [Nannocystaceae bacterium]